jgi:hypothetical protein
MRVLQDYYLVLVCCLILTGCGGSGSTPKVSIEDISVDAGDKASLKVSLSKVSMHAVTVNYRTRDGSAVAYTNYTPKAGTLTFAPGETEHRIKLVSLRTNSYQPSSKTLTVELSNAANASLGHSNAVVTIKSIAITNATPKPEPVPLPVLTPTPEKTAESTPASEPPPTTTPEKTAAPTPEPQLSFEVNSVSVDEGLEASLVVALSKRSAEKVTVNFRTKEHSAEKSKDYIHKSERLTFAKNETQKVIKIETLPNNTYKREKIFFVELFAADKANISGNSSVQVTINTTSPKPVISFVADNNPVTEGGTVSFIVSLSRPSEAAVTGKLRIISDSMEENVDYEILSPAEFNFPANDNTEKTLEVKTLTTGPYKSDKAFTATLSGLLEDIDIDGTNSIDVTINTTDSKPVLQVNADNNPVTEGGTVSFIVSLSRPSEAAVTGKLRIISDSMEEDENYQFLSSADFTFPPNETTDQTIQVKALHSETYSGDGAITAELTLTSTGDIDIDDDSAKVIIKPAIPEAVDLTLDFIQNKIFRFTWQSSPKATRYELGEDIEGTSNGTSRLIKSLDHNILNYDHFVPLYARLDAAYELKSCNSSGCSDLQRVKIEKGEVNNNNTILNINDSIHLIEESTNDHNCIQESWFTNICTAESAVSLSKDGKILAVGNYTENSKGKNAGSVKVYTRHDESWIQMGSTIYADNAQPEDDFGAAVSLSDDGNILAVGAYREDGADNSLENSGAVYVYEYNDQSWTQMGSTIYANNPDANDLFGKSVSLAADGKTLAVGAHEKDSTDATNSGAAYVFIFNGENWQPQGGIIKASTPIQHDHFGRSVSLNNDGDVLAVGAPSSLSNNGYGGVYVFTLNNNKWIQQGSPIKAKHVGAKDHFGLSISLSGDGKTLAVGAFGDDNNQSGVYPNGTEKAVNSETYKNSGAAYVFSIASETNEWDQQAFIKSMHPRSVDWYGWSVSLSDDGKTLAVGAYFEDSIEAGIHHKSDKLAERSYLSANSGQVYLYTRTASGWSEQAYIKAKNVVPGERFGASVSLSGNGDTLAVGSSYHNDKLRVHIY